MSLDKEHTEAGGTANSPAASGPAGSLFEGQVGAHYLLSMLAGGSPRGLPGAIIRSIKLQRASTGFPLDDVIVHAKDSRGNDATLEIQVKRSAKFTATDRVFASVVPQLKLAVKKEDFDNQTYELAVAIEKTSTNIEKYQDVLLWARNLETAESFTKQVFRKGLSNSVMREFVVAFQAQLKSADAPYDDAFVWRILRRFQILVFDFNRPGSESEWLARDRARMLLSPENSNRAADLWENLTTIALKTAATGGERSKAELLETLASNYSHRFAGDRRLNQARDALDEASNAALADIDDYVGSTHLDRFERVDQAYSALAKNRYLEIRGNSGVGKSGILKQFGSKDKT